MESQGQANLKTFSEMSRDVCSQEGGGVSSSSYEKFG